MLIMSESALGTAFEAFCSASYSSCAHPKTVIVAAHPDDETISAGGRLTVLPDVHILHVTDGAPRNMLDATEAGFGTREAYARARRGELAASLAVIGKDLGCTRQLAIVDQEASLDLAGLAVRVAQELESLEPDLVLTHPYEGGHPDHDATAFAVHAARKLIGRESGTAPELAEFTSYHDKEGRMSFYEFLPCHGYSAETVFLSEQERDVKRRMLQTFRTQQATIAPFPVELERFRIAPLYDFTMPPHAGTLLYERYNWGMRGAQWRDLAKQALEALEIGSPI